MSNAVFQVPFPENEPVLSYAPGSAERAELQAMVKKMKAKKVAIPMTIGGKKVTTKEKISINFQNKDLDLALKTALGQLGVTYKINGKKVSLQK